MRQRRRLANAKAATGEFSVTFKLTNLTGAPGHLSITAGNNQSALINTAFASPFIANVSDSGNNPIQNVVVSFTAPASGKSGSFPGALLTVNATTDASGNAQAPIFTANSVAGAYNVVAAGQRLSPPTSGSPTRPGRPS